MYILSVFLGHPSFGDVNPVEVPVVFVREDLIVDPNDRIVVAEAKLDIPNVDVLLISFILDLAHDELRPGWKEHSLSCLLVNVRFVS